MEAKLRNLTIGMTAAVACIALAATAAGAQSRTVYPTWYSDTRSAAESSNPYPFMDSVGFPQEWHAHRDSPDQEGDTLPRPAVARTPRYRGNRNTLQPMRPSFNEEPGTAPARAVNRSTYTATRRSSRTGASDPSYSESQSQWKPARPRATTKSYAAQKRLSSRSLSYDSQPAQPRWRPSGYRPSSKPYAFMDTVGFPQPYHPVVAQTRAISARRTTTIGARRVTRSHTALPPGFVEIR